MKMSLQQREEIKRLVEDCASNVVQRLEEDRHYPSIREAGTAATNSAIDYAHDTIIETISKITQKYGTVDVSQAFVSFKFDEILPLITADNHGDFEELTEVEDFVNDNGERKYRYVNTVYHHKAENRFLLVEVQKTADGEIDLGLSAVREVKKKEIVTYEWQ